VTAPDGSKPVNNVYFNQGSKWVLESTLVGTYTIFLDPDVTYSGTASVQVASVTDLPTQSVTVDGAAVSSTFASGQNRTLTFASSGGNLKVSLPSSSVSGLKVTVTAPDGSKPVNQATGVTGSQWTLNSAQLGTYTIFLDPQALATGTTSVQVTTIGGGLAAPLAKTDAATGSGQGATTETATGQTLPSSPTDSWTPNTLNKRGYDWESHRSDDSVQAKPALLTRPGVTAVAGQVLSVGGEPIPGVSIRLGTKRTTTRADGRFLLTHIPAGHEVLKIDASASKRGNFGKYEVGVDVRKGQLTVLPYTVWLTKIDTAHSVSFPSPTTEDTVITTPEIPGFEVHLPKGTTVQDEDGNPVASLSITAVPVDRPPFPLPPGVQTPVYFTVQPGGSYVMPDGATIVYPNLTHVPAGSRVEFWDYDPDGRGWYVYGHGTVTTDGKQVVPDPGVKYWEFSGAMINVNGLLAALLAKLFGQQSLDADPVDLQTGLFINEKTDLELPDTMPISVTRSYRQLDNRSRPFGIGANYNYGIFLQSAQQYQQMDFILPDSQKIHYVRTSPGTSWSDAVFRSTSSPGMFYQSTVAWNGNGWDVTLSDGTVYVFGVNQPLQAIRDRHGNTITLTRTNGQSGNIVQITSPHGRWIKLDYDGSGRISRAHDNIGRAVGYGYDGSGRLTTVTDPANNMTRYAYDTANRMTSITDPRSISYLTNTYDSQSRVATQTLANGGVYGFIYTTDANGKITATTVTDPNGNTRRVTYDASGYWLTDTHALGKPEQQEFTVTRDAGSHAITSITDQLGRETRFVYNDWGFVTEVTAADGTSSARSTHYQYDGEYGQISRITDQLGHHSDLTYTSRGDLASETDPLGRSITYTYTGDGQTASIADAQGHTTRYGYDLGDLTSATDPLNRTTTLFVDAAGRTVLRTGPDGNSTTTSYDPLNQVSLVTNPAGDTESYLYDANGNVTKITDAATHATTITYGNDDLPATVKDALDATRAYTYDKLGNLTQYTAPSGKITTFSYDGLNRQTFVGYNTQPGPGYDSTQTITYDGGNRATRLVDSANGTITADYNAHSQITAITSPQGSITRTYDDVGRETSMTASGSSAVSYTYNNADELTDIDRGSDHVDYTYDSLGRPAQVVRPSITQAYAYDDASQLTGITYSNSGGTLGDLQYTHDTNGNITAVTGSWARTSLPLAQSGLIYNAVNQLTAVAGTTLTYDTDGHLTDDGTTTFTWDSRGQLTHAVGGGYDTTYGYDPVGRRASQTVNGTTTNYLMDGPSPIKQTTGGTTTTLLNGPGPDNTLLESTNSDSVTLLTDQLGSVVGLADVTGTVTTTYTYDPYGKPQTGGTGTPNPHQFAGQETDQNGLIYMRARYYSPTLQRFISSDPLGIADGTNTYSYVHGNPVNMTDPSGTFAWALAGCLGGGAISIFVDWINHATSGRKFTAAQAVYDGLTGCATGAALTMGIGGIYRAYQSIRFTAEVVETQATLAARPAASTLERTGSALRDDVFHRSVSWVVDNPAAQRFLIKGGDGVRRDLYQLPGEVNGKPGVFEWIIDRSGTITHQRFIPGGNVTGFPNQVP
jgi:RHS repeat-associated protein